MLPLLLMVEWDAVNYLRYRVGRVVCVYYVN